MVVKRGWKRTKPWTKAENNRVRNFLPIATPIADKVRNRYLAPNDLRTLLIPIAAAECNLVVLLLSPRNSFEAQAHLIAANQCSTLIVDKVFNHVASNLQVAHRIEAPNLWHILDERQVDIRPRSILKTWASCQDEGIVKLHTSGSTGLPKSVYISHAVLSTVDIQRTVPDINGAQCQLSIFAEAKSPYTAFPFFHVAGFELACFMLFSGSRMVLGPPHIPTSLEVVRTVLKIVRPDAVLLPPSILDEIVLDTVLLEELCQVDTILYGGGQVSNLTGDVLARRARLFNGMGSTEIGSICLMPLKAQDWKYFRFAAANGITWQPIGTKSEEYELIVTRDPKYLPYQAVFHSFPELSEWRSKDIFAKHPSVEDLWEYRGRLDDLIVLSTGEKLNPSVIEAVILSSSSRIKSALVIGSKRPRPALLVELDENLQGSTDGKLEIKNVIVRYLASDATHIISRDGQIALEDMVISSVDKPFHRTGKGTVHRRLTQDLYRLEIDAIYSRSQIKGNNNSEEWNLDNSSIEGLCSSLLENFQHLLHSDILEINDNLFYFGLDSRQAQIAALSIRKALSLDQQDASKPNSFKVDVIYSNPTVISLSQRLLETNSTKPEPEESDYQRILRLYSAE